MTARYFTLLTWQIVLLSQDKLLVMALETGMADIQHLETLGNTQHATIVYNWENVCLRVKKSKVVSIKFVTPGLRGREMIRILKSRIKDTQKRDWR